MAWMHCRGCSTKFAVGLLRCPQCQAISELYAVPEEVVEVEEEAAMPKITVAAGPSNSLDPAEEVAAEELEEAPPSAGDTQEPAPVEVGSEASAETASDGPDDEPEPALPSAPKKRVAKKTAPPSGS